MHGDRGIAPGTPIWWFHDTCCWSEPGSSKSVLVAEEVLRGQIVFGSKR